MSLDIKAMAVTIGAVWGGSFLITGLANLLVETYGQAYLELGASIYPGYNGPGGFGSVIVVTLYAALDGAVVGAILAWIYNFFSRPKAHAKPM